MTHPRKKVPSFPQSPKGHHSIIAHSYSSGPLPSPKDLREYDQIFPGAAEMIFRKLDEQAVHRQRTETAIVKGEFRQIFRAQLFAFLLALAGLGSATYLATIGQPYVAGIFGTTTIGSMLAAFLIGKKHKEKESKSK